MTTAYVGNANDLVVSGFTRSRDGKVLNDALISVAIYDSTNTLVENASNLALAPDGNNTGGYIGVIPSSSVALVAGKTYRAFFSSSNYDWSTNVYFTPQNREG